MKSLKWMMLFMAVATMPLLTSCDDKDNEGDVDVTGTYTGTITALLDSSNATAVVAATGNNYSLTLTDLRISAMGFVIPIGDVTIANVKASKGKLSGGETISVEVTLPDDLAGMAEGATKIPLDVSLKSGIVSGKNLKFTLSISNVPVMGAVEVDFNGNK